MLTIGQLAEKTGVTTVAIRYYERNQLLPKPKRSKSGYRLYSEEAVTDLTFIQNAKRVGFELKEIKSLLDLQHSKQSSSSVVKSQIQQKISNIQEKISLLQKIKRDLVKMDKSCDGKLPVDQCPILKKLQHKREQS